MADHLTTMVIDILGQLKSTELSERSWETVAQVLGSLPSGNDPLTSADIVKLTDLARFLGDRAGRVDDPIAAPEPLSRRIAELVHRIGGLGDAPTLSMPEQPSPPDDVVRA